jgi:plastocyanin
MSEGKDDGGVSRRKFLRTAAGTATAAGATGTAAAQEGGGNESGGNMSAGGNGSGGGGGGGATTTVAVGPGGQLIFEPAEVQIEPGETVEWVWESGGHNVVPEEGEWGYEEIAGPGTTYSHTFEEAASFEYVCEPHAGAGMVGSVTVGSGGGGGSSTILPSSAKAIGVAATAAMMSTLGLAYFFIRYGGDYEQPGE